MYAVSVTFDIHPDQFKAFLVRVNQQARDTLQFESACQRFDVCSDQETTNTVFLYELYDDANAFAEHLSSAHFKAFAADVENMVVDKTVKTFSRVEIAVR